MGIYLWLLPLRFIGLQAAAAHIIDPGSGIDRAWQIGRVVAACGIGLHLCLALARGGSMGCFLRPFKNLFWLIGRLRKGEYITMASEQIHEFVTRLRLRHHFLLGVRGFVVAFAWLVIPTAVYAATNRPGGGGVVMLLLGATLLLFAFAWTPFLQRGSLRRTGSARGFSCKKFECCFVTLRSHG